MAGNNGKRNLEEIEMLMENEAALPEIAVQRLLKANETLDLMSDPNNVLIVKVNQNNSPKYIGEMMCPVKPEDLLVKFPTIPRENRYFILTIKKPNGEQHNGALDMRFTPEPVRKQEPEKHQVSVDTGDPRIDQIFGMFNQAVERFQKQQENLYEQRLRDYEKRIEEISRREKKDPFEDIEKLFKLQALFNKPAETNHFTAMEKIGENYLSIVEKLAKKAIRPESIVEAVTESESKLGSVISLVKDLAPVLLPILQQLTAQQPAQTIQQPQRQMIEQPNVNNQMALILQQNEQMRQELNALREQIQRDFYEPEQETEEEPEIEIARESNTDLDCITTPTASVKEERKENKEMDINNIPPAEIQGALKLYNALNAGMDFEKALEQFKNDCPVIWKMFSENPDQLVAKIGEFSPELANSVKDLIGLMN